MRTWFIPGFKVGAILAFMLLSCGLQSEGALRDIGCIGRQIVKKLQPQL